MRSLVKVSLQSQRKRNRTRTFWVNYGLRAGVAGLWPASTLKIDSIDQKECIRVFELANETDDIAVVAIEGQRHGHGVQSRVWNGILYVVDPCLFQAGLLD